MKSVVILVAVFALAGSVWWFTSGQDEATGSAAGDAATIEPENDPDAEESVLAGEADELMDSDDAVSEASPTSDEELVAGEASTDGTSSENSPFAVVESVEEQESAPLEEMAQQPPSPADEEILNVVEGTQGALEQPIEVPRSYPVTEAAKYFIPKEERGPGRLGGPPPLDFPGGPSDPNRNASDVFQPPTAPGQ